MPVDPMSWRDWIHWRSGAGRRPKHGCDFKSEAALWRSFSEDFYGAGWKNELRSPAVRGEEPAATVRGDPAQSSLEPGREAAEAAIEGEEAVDAEWADDAGGELGGEGSSWGGHPSLQAEALTQKALERQEALQEEWLRQGESAPSRVQHFEMDASSVAGSAAGSLTIAGQRSAWTSCGEGRTSTQTQIIRSSRGASSKPRTYGASRY